MTLTYSPLARVRAAYVHPDLQQITVSVLAMLQDAEVSGLQLTRGLPSGLDACKISGTSLQIVSHQSTIVLSHCPLVLARTPQHEMIRHEQSLSSYKVPSIRHRAAQSSLCSYSMSKTLTFIACQRPPPLSGCV